MLSAAPVKHLLGKPCQIRRTTVPALWTSILIFMLASHLISPNVHAQTSDEIAAQFKKNSPEEETKFKTILAEPWPVNATFSTLDTLIRQKQNAAVKLSDETALHNVLQMAAKLHPDTDWKNNLAMSLAQQGKMDESIRLMGEALAGANSPHLKLLYQSNTLRLLVLQDKVTAAQNLISEIETNAGHILRSARRQHEFELVHRALATGKVVEGILFERLGKSKLAMDSLIQAENNVRKAMEYSVWRPMETRYYAYEQLANVLLTKTRIESNLNTPARAEATTASYLRLMSEYPFRGNYLGQAYSSIGDIRFSQRDFKSAENLKRNTQTILEKINISNDDPRITNIKRDLASALAAQHKNAAALAEFDKLDALAANDDKIKARVRYPFERGWVYLTNSKFADAAALYADVVVTNSAQYGEHHFFTAQARGLQGVATWNASQGLSDAASKATALALLSASVADYMLAANADFVGDLGLRREMREAIFAAYLDAVTTLEPAAARNAIAAADWVRSGSVQDALADAAVRSAASGSSGTAVADLVRREQDAKNEIKGLRDYLSGETGSARSTLPEIAKKMRERIAELETARIDLQKQIKAQFPDYDRLVRPSAPTVADIQNKLKANEALLMLLPTDKAVYVWSVTKESGADFARADLAQTMLAASVRRLRATLDLGTMGGTLKNFDNKDASDLYVQLLKPLEQHFKGKNQLIVAAGGALGQIPFAMLQTSPHTGALKDAPWLIKEAAVTHVPSIGSWLALQGSQNRKVASQPLLAWGDPQFDLKAGANTKAAVRAVMNITHSSTNIDLEKDDIKALRSAIDYAKVPPLPETRDELQAIAKILQAKDSDVVLGKDATKESVLKANTDGVLRDKRVIAFATHGLMAGDLPNLTQPALAMAATGKEAAEPLSPLLTLEDVLGLKLNADWVVLSACNTAAADGKGEEALSGLARGFFYAGTRSLLVTHWSVDSESAKDLTTATFEHYSQNPQAPKAESLRQAMLKVMQSTKDASYAHPAFWAPYALVGDGGR